MYKLLLVIALLCGSLPCLTQTSPTPVSPGATSFADEAIVVEQDDVVYRYSADGKGSKVETAVFRIQSNAALQNVAVLSFPYAEGDQRLDLVYVRVRKPAGTVVETPIADAQDQPAQVTRIAPMYSDLHLKQIPVRSLAVGDKLEYQFRITQQNADIPDEFWGRESFGAGIVFLERGIELRFPKQKHVTVSSPEYKPDISEAGDERVYRWKGSQLRSTSAKDDDDAQQNKVPPVSWTTFPSWEAVGLWYRGLIAGRDAVTPAIQAKADELTANTKTDTERVRALYDFVSSHNHYIGVDFGIGRYQPHAAAEVMTNQYGDCKDKHTLLAALLRAKGFQVSAVLIGEGIEMNEAVPMPAAFNHVITQTNVDGEKVWLDTTTEVAPYRVLLPVLRDKQALVVPPAAAPNLQKTPAQLPFTPLLHFETKSVLEESGSLKGHIDVGMRGDDEILMRFAARQIARAQWDQLSQTYSNASGFSGTTSATVLDPPDDTSAPWHLRYDYADISFGDWGNYRIGALLPYIGLPAFDEKVSRKKDIELGGPHIEVVNSSIRLPKGYGADLPDAVHLNSLFAKFDRTYQLQDGNLKAEVRLEILTAKVPAADLKEYKKFLDDLGQEPWIQLTSKDRAAGEKGPPPAGENNSVASELVRQAQSALATNDKDLARKKLDEAAAVNDKQQYLWSYTGYLAALSGKFYEAASDYQRELKQHPDETKTYLALIDAQARLGQKAAERDSLLAYSKAEPRDSTVVLFTGGRLLATDHVAEAVEVYRAGSKAIPENKLIEVELASALLREGKPDEAVTLAKSAIDGSSDPDVLNDGAYVLVSHNAELPLAESSSRKAIDLLETGSTEMVLDSVNANSFHRVNLLLASWDTLGWIYFAEGNTNMAEQYTGAAWRIGGHAEVGLHFGKVLEKQGDNAQALRIYELALGDGKTNSTTPIQLELHARVDALKRRGIPSQNLNAEAILQEQRTYHVPRAGDMKGSAIFFLLISATKTEKVGFVSGDDGLRSESARISHLDLGLALPKGSHALLLRSGVLFCSAKPMCEFVLTPPQNANVR